MTHQDPLQNSVQRKQKTWLNICPCPALTRFFRFEILLLVHTSTYETCGITMVRNILYKISINKITRYVECFGSIIEFCMVQVITMMMLSLSQVGCCVSPVRIPQGDNPQTEQRLCRCHSCGIFSPALPCTSRPCAHQGGVCRRECIGHQLHSRSVLMLSCSRFQFNKWCASVRRLECACSCYVV